MTREELFGAIAGVTVLEPLLRSAYEAEEERIWREGNESPHGESWATSFHASQFPDAENDCERFACYSLMDPPAAEPFTPALRVMFDQGLDCEHHFIRRLRNYGVLLSTDVSGGGVQTGFVDAEHWLTGNADGFILPPGTQRSHAVEVKTTSAEKVAAMKENSDATPFSHSKYLKQIGTYIALAREAPFAPTVIVCAHSGFLIRGDSCATGPTLNGAMRLVRHEGPCVPEIVKLEPPYDGTLIYSSREEPLTTVSYHATYDPEMMERGREILKNWRDLFQRGILGVHPREGESAMWSVGQCQYCPVKKEICKPDYKAKIARLEDSHLIGFAKEVRPGYDYAETRRAVLQRWKAPDLAREGNERSPEHEH